MANPNKKYKVGDLYNCNKCGAVTVATAAMVKHGHYKCNPCNSKYSAIIAKKNMDGLINRIKKYRGTEKGKKMMLKKTRRYRDENKEKYKAHWTVAHAIKAGKLIKSNCEKCGSVKAHAHHDDYSKPLDVRWLCPKCHNKHHRLLLELSKP